MNDTTPSPYRSILGYDEVYKAYYDISNGKGMLTMWSIAVGISFILIFIEIIKQYRNSMDRTNGQPDMKAFLQLIAPLLIYQLVIFITPVVIDSVEKILTLMENELATALNSGQSQKSKETLKAMISQWEESPNKNIPTATVSTIGISSFVDYVGSISIQPTLVILESWMFSFAIVGRFLYLLLLKLIAPIAIVGLIHPKTQAWFYTWIKNMLMCYLLVPAITIADAFANALNSAFTIPSITLSLFVMVILKIGLYSLTAKKVFSLF